MRPARLPMIGTFIFLLAVASASAQAPSKISFQGRLTDSGGSPINNPSLSVTFALYDDGTKIWEETQSVNVVDGIYSVLLGSVVPIDSVRFDDEFELGVKVGADAEMTPRIPLAAASTARSLPGLYTYHYEDFQRSGYNVIGGSELNTVAPGVAGATVFGSSTPKLCAPCPDNVNEVSGNNGAVSGGSGNKVFGEGSSIGGGYFNHATGINAFVGGGNSNVAGGNFSAIAGGSANHAGGSHATVPGGSANRANGAYSLAAGYNARAKHEGSFVWNDRSITSGNDSLVSGAPNQFLIRAAGGVGIGTTSPDAQVHIGGTVLGVSALDVENDDLILEDEDAVLGVYSSNVGNWGSAVTLVEMNNLEFQNGWTMVRGTAGGGNDLHFRYGTDPDYGAAATRLTIQDDGVVVVPGNLTVAGSVSKTSGSFRIDHPLDPANKYLFHSFVESPDMMNVYNGNVILDESGGAIVELPSYFEALNRDFRYQLTCIGGYAPIYVAEEITANHFRIAGGTPGMKVSWQVTGVRQDPYAEAHRIQPEVDKPAAERGTYLHPEVYGGSH